MKDRAYRAALREIHPEQGLSCPRQISCEPRLSSIPDEQGKNDPLSALVQPPLPPPELIELSGSSGGDRAAVEREYLEVGSSCRDTVVEALGPEWSWNGKKMLDFGCGAGRLLRHLLPEAEVAEIYGSDLDPRPIEWVRQNLCPPVADARTNGFDPPLDFPSGSLDLVTAFSVFTHLGTNWAEWLLEIRRVLAPEGILIASYLDGAFAREMTGIDWDEDGFGMSVFGYATPGMPYVNVAQSEWWLREHWGRAFEIVSLQPGHVGHGVAVLRPRPGEFTVEDLLTEPAEELRYVAARKHQQDLFRWEAGELRKAYERSLEDLAFSRRLGPLAKLVPTGLRKRVRSHSGDHKGVPQR